MPLLRKEEFIARLRQAISTKSGFAAGKIGDAEQKCMLQPIVQQERKQSAAWRAFGLSVKFHGFNQTALFPGDVDFYARYNQFYISHIRNLDALRLADDAIGASPSACQHSKISNASNGLLKPGRRSFGRRSRLCVH